MSQNFSINTNFQMNNFDNSIKDFNKSFSTKIKNDFEENSEFENIFNSIANKDNKIDTKNVSAKNSEASPVAKLALDIQNGFSNSLNDLNAVQRQAEDDFETFAAGGNISVHEVMISAQKSNLAMQMAIQLRNQMLNAYNEFKNMSV